MRVRMAMLSRRPGLTAEDFRARWRDVHAPLVSQLPRLRGYEQNHVLPAQNAEVYKKGTMQIDGISELRFDHQGDLQAAFASEIGRSVNESEKEIAGDIQVVTVDRIEVMPPPTTGTFVKQIAFPRRLPGLSADDFVREWVGRHAALIAAIPGIVGYRQNVIVGRQSPQGIDVGYEGFPIDGIVELWYASAEAEARAFHTPEGMETIAHTSTMAQEVTIHTVAPLAFV